MSLEDRIIWNKARATLLDKATAVYYDVGLGGQTEVPPGTPPEQALMWQRVTQKRIDVVIETENFWKIIELRAAATASAIGRLLMYKDMWKGDPPDKKDVILYLVSDLQDGDVMRTASALEIIYLVF